MQGIFAALELVFWRVFMLLWPWLRWPKPSAASLRGDFCAGLTGAALPRWWRRCSAPVGIW